MPILEKYFDPALCASIMYVLRISFAALFAVTSLIAIVLTIYDKSASWKRGRRIPERTLLLVAFLGGALAMYVTMQIIRHKTQHPNFMIPLPLFMVLHVVAAWAVFLWQ